MQTGLSGQAPRVAQAHGPLSQEISPGVESVGVSRGICHYPQSYHYLVSLSAPLVILV
jgi:hypothetical protein